MLCVEDYIDALNWAKSIGGLDKLIGRADASTKVISDWVAKTPAVEFLASAEETRSNTSVCLRFADPAIANLDDAGQQAFVKGFVALLEAEKVAYDIASYRDAPPGLRIWCGATVETSNVEALIPWLDWAFATQKAALKAAA
jgi:phosphoserine aminotransferase